ncbi:MAG TPA: hypothetical protein VLF20_05775 [Patescibacteria group bacterium]|nr:hypothetical protein [Patescibacteria group bacterium]
MSFDVLGLIVAGASALGAFAANLLFKFFGNTIDSLFEKWRFVNADKRKLADEILDICAEAQAGNYQKLPENERKIYQLLTYLESIESNVQELLLHFYNNWITLTTIIEKTDSKDAHDMRKILYNETEKSRKKLVRAVGKWKK